MNTAPRIRADRPRRAAGSVRGAFVLAAIVLALLVAPSLDASAFTGPVSASGLGGVAPWSAHPIARAAPAGVSSHVTPTGVAAGSARPSALRAMDATDNYTCSKVNATVCVSVQNGSYQVVPSLGNLTSSVKPEPNATIAFWVKSEFKLDWSTPTPAPTGDSPHTPIRINVTGTLWNGDNWTSQYDGTVYHANQGDPFWSGPTASTNKSYPYWYSVVIKNNTNGVPNFFPGEYVTWWIYLVHRTSSGLYTNVTESPHFHYLIAEAWAYSPYKGSAQYGGSNASSLDLQLYQNPLVPNWNDTVKLTLQTTPADAVVNAYIGNASAIITETLPNGEVLANNSIYFDVTVSGVIGAVTTPALIVPAKYSQIAGATVRITIVAFDSISTIHYQRDMISLPPILYSVGGNGSFLSGSFQNDVSVTSNPATVGAGIEPGLLPSTNVTVVVTSKNSATALQSAEIRYLFQLPALHESIGGLLFMTRLNSTNFMIQLPQVPVGGYFNFSVLVWDYQNTLEVSPQYGFSILPFDQVIPSVAPSLTFVWLYVFDNGTGTWVDNATVTILGSGGFVDIQTRTAFGVAYPNSTGQLFTPLLLPSNVSYQITINDPQFVPAGHLIPYGPVELNLTLRNPMTAVQTLRQTAFYTIVQSGNQLYFWLNSTPPGPTYSPAPQVTATALGGLIGLIAAVGAALPLIWWWNDIARRRKEQEKKVTL
ncbi:MAG TPA: hypothetical protein VGV89_01995 [Thermoplasmata archaeon]|nr:hypothetical protein [Thermoplasmata archaeon]